MRPQGHTRAHAQTHAGDRRSIGRFAVGSTRSASRGDDLGPGRTPSCKVGEVVDSDELGVEMDLIIAQMTLRSKHLAALDGTIANMPDVKMVFGDATMQVALRVYPRVCPHVNPHVHLHFCLYIYPHVCIYILFACIHESIRMVWW